MVHSAAIAHLPPGCSEGSAQPHSWRCAANAEGCELFSTESYDTRTSYGLHAQSKETGLCYHTRRTVLESVAERQQVSDQAAGLGQGQRAASCCPSGGHKAVPWLGPAAGRPFWNVPAVAAIGQWLLGLCLARACLRRCRPAMRPFPGRQQVWERAASLTAFLAKRQAGRLPEPVYNGGLCIKSDWEFTVGTVWEIVLTAH